MKAKINCTFFLLIISSTLLIAQCDTPPSFLDFPSVADTNSGPIPLIGIPEGGVFSGNDVLFNAFNPNLAGPGIHEITYTYTEPVSGCITTATATILVFTYIDVWVSYQLGTIQPKLSIANETFMEQLGNYQVFVADLNGRIVYQDNIELTNALQFPQFNELNLPQGQYILSFRNQHHSFSKQVVLGR